MPCLQKGEVKLTKKILRNLFLPALVLFLIISSAYAQESNKIYLIKFKYSSGQLSIAGISEAATSSGNFNSNGDYKINVISVNGDVLSSSKFSVPFAVKPLNSGDFAVFAPRFDSAALIKVYDNSQKEILSVALQNSANVIQNSEAETALAQEQRNSLKLSWLYVLFPVVIAALFIGYHEFDRKKWHIEFNAHKRQQSAMALRSYVASNLKKGFKREQIRNALAKNNYNNHEIEEAFKGIK